MRSLAIICTVFLTGCASLPPAPSQSMSVLARHPSATLERPWLMPVAKDEVTLFDTRALQALRELDRTQALNQNGSGRRVRHPGMWVGIGVGAAVGIHVVNEAIDVVDDVADDTAESLFECFFDVLFGGDCDDED